MARKPPAPIRRSCALALGGVMAASVAAAPVDSSETLLRNVSFEELANLVVTTVSRRDENFFRAPAAVSVVTQDAAEAAGARTLPEALRDVPGLNVAQIGADTWAIGARGFQWQYANKLLVMIDGRSIYSPTAGGVHWEDYPVFLGDLDRIEVVRGPGGATWGANAVNGVINIASRSAFATTGTRLFGGVGDGLETFAGGRYGFRPSQQTAIRLYGQYQRHEDNALPGGASAEDRYRLGFGGVRIDWTPTAQDAWFFEAGAHERSTRFVREIPTLAQPPTYLALADTDATGSGRHLLGNWRHEWTDGASLTVHGYLDRLIRRSPQFAERVDTGDLDLVFTASPGERHHCNAGLNYRLVRSSVEPGFWSFNQKDVHPQLFSGFLQDEIAFRSERLRLSLGTKVEHHRLTGWNLQPTARLSWSPNDDLVVWGAVGRAVREPTLAELTVNFDALVYPPGALDPALPAVVRLYCNPDLQPEKLLAAEVGLRWKTAAGFAVDAAVFSYNYRDNILFTTGGVVTQSQPAALVLQERAANGLTGESYGGELALQWEPGPSWRLGASASVVRMELHTHLPDPLDYERDEDTTPGTTLLAFADWHAGPWRAHAALRRVGAVPYYAIPAYTELDARLGRGFGEHMTVALVGHNLLHSQHPEYDFAIAHRLTELRRSINLTCQWDY